MFFLRILIKSKKKISILAKEAKSFFDSSREDIRTFIKDLRIENEKRKQQKTEQRENERQEIQQDTTFSEEEENSMNYDNNVNAVENIKIVRRGGCFTALLCLVLIVFAGLFAYKKIMLDFNGVYATDRITYTDEHGFSMLITYYPNYQTGNSKGFAIIHIPITALFTEELQAQANGNDFADSETMLAAYKLLAEYELPLQNFGFAPKSIDIGNHGKYFAKKFELHE